MNLIIQGLEVETPDLKSIAKLTGATAIDAITPAAFRLRDANPDPAIAPYCERAALDYAFVAAGAQLADFRLAVMDMDSTLITIECIDEIADLQQLKPQVAAITARAMRGEIEYAQSLRERVALLAGLDAGALQRVYDERLQLSPGAEALLAGFKRCGIKTLLVSGGFNFFTSRLQQRLGLDYTCSNELEIADGRLTGRVVGDIVDAVAKRKALLRTRAALKLEKAQVIAFGDGANDLLFMQEAGVSIAYHAKPVVRAQATHALSHVGLDGVLNLYG
jgi:phosphoserine phosphatase